MKAAVCAISGFPESAAIPVPVTVNIASANGCKSHPKWILLTSKSFSKEVLSNPISVFIKSTQRIAHAINAGNINDCKLFPICGMKNLIGPMKTFIVMIIEMNGATRDALCKGSLRRSLCSLLPNHLIN